MIIEGIPKNRNTRSYLPHVNERSTQTRRMNTEYASPSPKRNRYPICPENIQAKRKKIRNLSFDEERRRRTSTIPSLMCLEVIDFSEYADGRRDGKV